MNLVHLKLLNIRNSFNASFGAPKTYEGNYEKNDETLQVMLLLQVRTLASRKFIKELILGRKS